jgi:hypothetical protein
VNERKESTVKNVERALIATGVALVFSGGIASAVILWTSATAAAAQPGIGTQLAAQLGTNPGTLADNGLHGGADLATAAATYIGITAADLRTQLAAGKSLADIAVANGKTRDGLIAALTAGLARTSGRSSRCRSRSRMPWLAPCRRRLGR